MTAARIRQTLTQSNVISLYVISLSCYFFMSFFYVIFDVIFFTLFNLFFFCYRV